MKRPCSCIPIVAAGLAGHVAVVRRAGAGLGARGVPPLAATSRSRAYSGYSSSGIATPVKVEIFEPTIPIPTVPQAELDFGYAKVKADSASTKGRASFLWPGDGVGEGLKTFFSQLGLPTSLVENGYPVQVNSQYPSDTTKQKQRAVPRHLDDHDLGQGQGPRHRRVLQRLQRRRRRRRRLRATRPDSGGLLPGLPGVPLLDNLDTTSSACSASAGSSSTSRSSSPADGDGSGRQRRPG